jgi:pantetheine-phosphate adenylyltransferase
MTPVILNSFQDLPNSTAYHKGYFNSKTSFKEEYRTVKLALYPGTFDPITKGHMDVITRAIRIFDRLVVAVAENPAKKPLFNLDERIDLTQRVVEGMEDCDRVEVVGFENLTVEFARSIGATAIIRGLRAVSDFEYELQIALTNRKLALDIESVFLMPSVEYIYLNSTIVKQVAKHGGDVRNFVPEIVMEKLEKKFKKLRIPHDTH